MKTERIKFNLERYNNGEYISLETRIGNHARIICTTKKDKEYPIVVLENIGKEREDTFCVTKTGKFDIDVDYSERDLFMVVNKQNPKFGEEYWFILPTGEICRESFISDKCDAMRIEFGNCFKTEEEAIEASRKIKKLLNATDDE